MIVAGRFGVPPWAMTPLARTLRAAGHAVAIAPLGTSVDCGERSVQRLLAVIDRPVAVVGHSRGGQLARVTAVPLPDLVRRLVTVGTPCSIGPPDRRAVDVVVRAVRAARRRGLPVLASMDGTTAACCDEFRRDLRAVPVVPWDALWSSEDTVAGDDGRPPPGPVDARDVGGSHLGLVLSRDGKRAVLDALA